MPANTLDIAKADPVAMLAQNYAVDLQTLSKLVPSVVTPREQNILRSLTTKYGITAKVSAESFYDVKGQLAKVIQEKLQGLSDDILEKHRAETPSKRRRIAPIEGEDSSDAI